jgi:cytochrome o ubiquinol oxidase subunit 2
MPGMTTQLNLMANRTGDFNGSSANISGEGFAGMAFIARAVPQNEFDEWVSMARTSTTSLTKGSYATLSAPSEYNPVTYYAQVDPNLFDALEMKYMQP